MSPKPSGKKQFAYGDHALIGDFQALRFVMEQLERKAANIIWNADHKDRDAKVSCIMQAAKSFSYALEKCHSKGKGDGKGGDGSGGGQAPKCDPQTEHEEFGVCVPNG